MRIQRIALPQPTSSGMRRPPPSAGVVPRLISPWLKLVSDAATRMSAASISSCAIAPTRPCTAATRGLDSRVVVPNGLILPGPSGL
nr:hypothetical protein [Spongiactinospora gelatinilytica]